MDTAGKNTKKIAEYIQNQLKEDQLTDQMTLKEYIDVYKRQGLCGKTVLLNAVAGLERPTSGHVFLNGRELHGTDPTICMVFQKKAIFPWKTVMQNVEFGPKMRGVPKAERRKTAQKFIDLVAVSYTHLDVYKRQQEGCQDRRSKMDGYPK